jgi:hypothetical protein
MCVTVGEGCMERLADHAAVMTSSNPWVTLPNLSKTTRE